jgi:hypothetical protein
VDVFCPPRQSLLKLAQAQAQAQAAEAEAEERAADQPASGA